jgi:hypothetical protein
MITPGHLNLSDYRLTRARRRWPVPNLTEVAMNHSRRIRHSLSGRLNRAGLLIASAAPAVLWADPPLPPGWKKYLPQPAHTHPLATGGTPGWQLTLMAVTVILLIATLVAIGYPGPGRTAAGERAHRSSDDRTRRHAEAQRQPQGEPPHPASQPGPDGFAGRFIQNTAAATSVAAGQNQPARRRRCPRGA